MQTVGHSVWWENWKPWKMQNTHGRMRNMVRNTQKRDKWEIHTVGPWVWQVTEKCGKWDKNTLWPGIWVETLKHMENENCTL